MAKSTTACGLPEAKVVSHPPKLLDMLVDAGLNKGFEWPDGFEYCAQDNFDSTSNGNSIIFCEDRMTFDEGCKYGYWCGDKIKPSAYHEVHTFYELAEDYKTSQISKQEYLEALDKAKGEVTKEIELDGSEATKLNNIVKVDVVLEPKLQTPSELWTLPNMLTEYSRKKESFSLLNNELDEKRKELYALQENIRTLCEQQGWRIEPI